MLLLSKLQAYKTRSRLTEHAPGLYNTLHAYRTCSRFTEHAPRLQNTLYAYKTRSRLTEQALKKRGQTGSSSSPSVPSRTRDLKIPSPCLPLTPPFAF